MLRKFLAGTSTAALAGGIGLYCYNTLNETRRGISLTSSNDGGRAHYPEEDDAKLQSAQFKKKWEKTVRQMQHDICKVLESIEESQGSDKKFIEDEWKRAEGGGGWTRVLAEGKVFEKAGVNVSTVYGELSAAAAQQMKSRGIQIKKDKAPFFACGISLVIHPCNPFAPTTHANYRYFEVQNGEDETIWWFGGGADLTPSYLFEEDAVQFHTEHKRALDAFDTSLYPRFKKWCDEYFYLPHRQETRGVGGIFYDDLDAVEGYTKEDGKSQTERKERLREMAVSCSNALIRSYVPIVNKRLNHPFDEAQKKWQQLRRGRYVEFNILIDRGTKFGLATPGSRVESILMSLPLTARWEYMHVPKPGSKEDEMLRALKSPREWVTVEDVVKPVLGFKSSNKPSTAHH